MKQYRIVKDPDCYGFFIIQERPFIFFPWKRTAGNRHFSSAKAARHHASIALGVREKDVRVVDYSKHEIRKMEDKERQRRTNLLIKN